MNGPKAKDGGRTGYAAGDGNPKAPPQDVAIEMAAIGSALQESKYVDDMAAVLKPAHFYRAGHGVIWQTVLDLWRDGQPIDALTVAARLKLTGQYAEVGGFDTLREIDEATPNAANAVYYAQIVQQKAVLRDFIEACNEGLREAYSGQVTCDEALASAERRLLAVGDAAYSLDTTTAGDAMTKAIERLESRTSGLAGLSSGYDTLDNLTDGWQPEQFVILAARPSMGKTAFGLNLLNNLHPEPRRGLTATPCLMVSIEMGEAEVGERLITIRSGLRNDQIKNFAGLSSSEYQKLSDALADVNVRSKLRFDFCPERTVTHIGALARRAVRKHGVKFILIDYLQLVDDRDQESRSRQERVASMSRGLKLLARALKVPVVALCQLNRNPEDRKDHRPMLADLRESGSLEQDADVVMLLHRPDYYQADDQPGLLEVHVAKHRQGPTGKVNLLFDRATGKIEPWTGIVPQNNPAAPVF